MRNKKKYSINQRVTGFFLILFIAAAVLSTYYFASFAGLHYDNGYKSFLQDAEDAARDLEESVSILDHQLEWLANSANDTTYWMANSQYERAIHMRHITENLRGFLQTSPDIEAVMIVQRNSDVVWESHTMDEECFITFLNNYGREYTIRQHLPAVMNGYGNGMATHWILARNIICYREDQMVGQIVADIYAAVDLQSLIPGGNEGSTYLLCTQNGDYLKVIAAAGADAAHLQNQTYRVSEHGSGGSITIGGETYISSYKATEAKNLKLLVLMPQKLLMENLKPMVILGLILIGVLLVIAIYGSRVIISYIRKPLDRMTRDLERIGGGDTDYRLEPAESTEILKVTTGVNTLLDELEKHSNTIMDQQKALYEMELLHRESQMKSLQAQINPHFLYNTLECIRSISQHYGVAEISKIITGMIRIYRYSASNASDGTVESEFGSAEAYTQIMQVRYEGRYHIYLTMEPELQNCYMPKMILQPLIENAVSHGLTDRYADGNVWVTAQREGTDVLITIRDNGSGINSTELEQIRERLEKGIHTERKDGNIGLTNVHMRIRKTFGDQYGITVESEEGEGTVVTIRFPQKGKPERGDGK